MQFQQYSHPDDAPTELWISGLTQDSVGYTTGLAATDRQELPGYNSGILCMVIAMMLLVIFNARHYGRFFRRLVKNVWSIRVRAYCQRDPHNGSLDCAGMCVRISTRSHMDDQSRIHIYLRRVGCCCCNRHTHHEPLLCSTDCRIQNSRLCIHIASAVHTVDSGLQLHPDPFGLRPARAYPYISFLSVGI